jgi:NAD(P)-dependent dehydrogenase (short-subunit alcohol dehydrogenase family)
MATTVTVLMAGGTPALQAELTAALTACGAGVHTVSAAVTAEELTTFGPIDLLVMLPAAGVAGGFEDVSAAAWDSMIETDLGLRFRLCQAVLPTMLRARAGSLLHLVPGAGLLGGEANAASLVLSQAVAGFSKAVALDLAGTELRSNLVGLGEGGIITAAALAVMLASPSGAGITGQVMLADATELHLLSQPRPVRTLHRADGWTLPRLAETLPARWRSALAPLVDGQPLPPAPTPGPATLEGKVAIVTGAGRGIGRAIAHRLAADGAAVVVNDLGVSLGGDATAEDPADTVVAEIADAGGQALADKGSVTDPAAVAAMVASALRRFGRLDIVVNNAGILRTGRIDAMPQVDWDAVLAVHLHGSLLLSRAAAPHLAATRGAYVHMASASGLIGSTAQANYAAAKMGIVGLSRALATDLREAGVRSNCVVPSSTSRMTAEADSRRQTELTAEALEILRRSRAASQPDQMAPLVAFLASDAAAGITGQVIGARGNELYLYSPFQPLRSLHAAEPWTAESLAARLPEAWAPSWMPLDRITDVFRWAPF